MVLATIVTSLANFLKISDTDVDFLDIMGKGDEQINDKDDAVIETFPNEEGDIATSSTLSDKGQVLPSSTSGTTTKPHSKKKVAESWED